MRSYSEEEAKVIVQEQQPAFNLVRSSEVDEESKEARVSGNGKGLTGGKAEIQNNYVLRVLQCLNIGDLSNQFNVTTDLVKQRLVHSLYGHHISGNERPVPTNPETLDYDLYGPIWLMNTLVVECSIMIYLNHHISQFMSATSSLQLDFESNFSVSRVSNLFFFFFACFVLAPAAIYLFARIRLLDGNTHFFRLFSIFGYSFAPYVPAIAFSIINVRPLVSLVILAACAS